MLLQLRDNKTCETQRKYAGYIKNNSIFKIILIMSAVIKELKMADGREKILF